jgi:hypothetical protein
MLDVINFFFETGIEEEKCGVCSICHILHFLRYEAVNGKQFLLPSEHILGLTVYCTNVY